MAALWPGKGAPKADGLPIEETEFGHVQKSSFRNVDRLDEEVIELDGPHSMVVAAGTEVVSFVLLGDQNAGKSTYLHSFGHSDDESFLEMMSLLPVLSTSFINTRFLTKDDPRPAMDEPPFIDTDLARSTLSLTVDDFAFWVLERELDSALVTSLPPGTRFVVIQFIEFGGDHLDQIMDPGLSKSDTTRDIVARSRAMLMSCRKVVYFVNAETLLEGGGSAGSTRRFPAGHHPMETDGDGVQPSCTPQGASGAHSAAAQPQSVARVARESLRLLCDRLRFLDALFARPMDLMVVVSRGEDLIVPDSSVAEALSMLTDVAALPLPSTFGASSLTHPRAPSSHDARAAHSGGPDARADATGGLGGCSVEALLQLLLGHMSTALQFKLRIGRRVVRANHLLDDGALNPEGINTTLAAMFCQDMVNATGNPETFVAGHLLECFKRPLLRVDEDDTFSLYIGREVFQEYLEELEGATEAPDTVLMQHFPATARRTVEVGMALRHHAASLSKFLVTVHRPARLGAAGGAAVCFATPDPEREAQSEPQLAVIVGGIMQGQDRDDIEIRFPYHTPLFELVHTYFGRNVPPELWLDQSWLDEGSDAAGRASLVRIHAGLTERVEQGLALLLESHGSLNQSSLRATSEAVSQSQGEGHEGTDETAIAAAAAATRRWLWELEDLMLAHRLLHRQSPAAPLRLQAPADDGEIGAVLGTVLCSVSEGSALEYPLSVTLECAL